jgi:predicted  nucleic acid-binding Zn-ribbon protein
MGKRLEISLINWRLEDFENHFKEKEGKYETLIHEMTKRIRDDEQELKELKRELKELNSTEHKLKEKIELLFGEKILIKRRVVSYRYKSEQIQFELSIITKKFIDCFTEDNDILFNFTNIEHIYRELTIDPKKYIYRVEKAIKD